MNDAAMIERLVLDVARLRGISVDVTRLLYGIDPTMVFQSSSGSGAHR
jgi:hypothetical protein